jgi:hypothetical protein
MCVDSGHVAPEISSSSNPFPVTKKKNALTMVPNDTCTEEFTSPHCSNSHLMRVGHSQVFSNDPERLPSSVLEGLLSSELKQQNTLA